MADEHLDLEGSLWNADPPEAGAGVGVRARMTRSTSQGRANSTSSSVYYTSDAGDTPAHDAARFDTPSTWRRELPPQKARSFGGGGFDVKWEGTTDPKAGKPPTSRQGAGCQDEY
jgi:hypothetical protein